MKTSTLVLSMAIGILFAFLLGASLQERPKKPVPPPAPKTSRAGKATGGQQLQVRLNRDLKTILDERFRIDDPGKPPHPEPPCYCDVDDRYCTQHPGLWLYPFLQKLNEALLQDIGLVLRLFGGMDDAAVVREIRALEKRQQKLTLVDQIAARETLLNDLLNLAVEER